jgi:hypothetical protein
MTVEECRRLYPAEADPGAIRVEMSLQGVSVRGVAIVVTDDPKFGERERPVRIVLSSAQATDLARRLAAVVDEL